MKTIELKQKTKKELERQLQELREKLRSLRFNIQLKRSKNVRDIRKIKKLIARVLTFINQKK